VVILTGNPAPTARWHPRDQSQGRIARRASPNEARSNDGMPQSAIFPPAMIELGLPIAEFPDAIAR